LLWLSGSVPPVCLIFFDYTPDCPTYEAVCNMLACFFHPRGAGGTGTEHRQKVEDLAEFSRLLLILSSHLLPDRCGQPGNHSFLRLFS
jgi:hypothetical protein